MSGTLTLLRPYMRRQWRALVVAAVGTVVVAGAEVLRPFPLKIVIDQLFAVAGAPLALDHGDLVILAGVAALVLFIALLEAGGGYLMDVQLARAGERIVHDLRVAIYAHLQRLSLVFHQSRHTGDLVTRVTGDVHAVGAIFSSSLGTLTSAGLTLLGMIIVGLVIDPLLALVAFATAPLVAFVAFRFRHRMTTLQRRQRATEGEIASLASESLSAIEQVKALGSERFENQRLERKSVERLETGFAATLLEGQFTRLIDILGAISTAAVLVVGAVRVAEGAISPGDLVVMVAYGRRIYRPLRTIAREWVRFNRSMARAERVAELLSSDDVLEEPSSHGQLPRPIRGEVAFDGVSFAYEAGRAALADVDLVVPAGQRVALIGRSGAGKSTLAALVARFHDPDSGRVRIDGIDVRDLPLAWVREHVGLVLQDPVLFTGTVAENIAWGVQASRPEIERAAAVVGAQSFVRALPEGFDTELDPGGAGLSGGQRQRLAIARTLLRAPAILILDEPTSGLDVESEREVLRGLDVLMAGRTTIIITHSLDLARRAERVVLLDGGRVVADGRPADMLADGGPFRIEANHSGIGSANGGRPLGSAADRARVLDPLETRQAGGSVR